MCKAILRALLRIIAGMAVYEVLGITIFALFANFTPLLTDLQAMPGAADPTITPHSMVALSAAYLASLVAGIWFGCSATLGRLLDRIGLAKTTAQQEASHG